MSQYTTSSLQLADELNIDQLMHLRREHFNYKKESDPLFKDCEQMLERFDNLVKEFWLKSSSEVKDIITSLPELALFEHKHYLLKLNSLRDDFEKVSQDPEVDPEAIKIIRSLITMPMAELIQYQQRFIAQKSIHDIQGLKSTLTLMRKRYSRLYDLRKDSFDNILGRQELKASKFFDDIPFWTIFLVLWFGAKIIRAISNAG